MNTKRANLPVTKSTLSSAQPACVPESTAAERVQMVWELTREAWAFMGKPLDESGLQRQVVCVVRCGVDDAPFEQAPRCSTHADEPAAVATGQA